ncbi:MAG: SHOCT domain-containing protein [Anaerolineales bacterium]
MPPRRAARRSVRRMTRRVVHRMRRRRRRRRILLVGGMIAVGTYALTSSQVEQQTGMQAEELTDEQLEQAMKQMGIETDELSDAEWEQVDAADNEPEDYLEELERLSELNKQGVITDEEFEAKKKELLHL